MKKLYKGAFLVTLSTFLVKVLSILYKIPYQNITGDKGFYIYQQMYPIYALIGALCAFAIPLAISERIANKKTKPEVISSSFVLLLGIAFILSGLIILFHPFLAKLLGDPHLSELFLPLIPLFFIGVIVSIMRGYFYSDINKISYVGYSIVIEQFFRVSFIVVVLFFFSRNVYQVAHDSFYGFSIGLLVAFLALFILFDFKTIKWNSFHLNEGLSILKRSFFLLITSSVLLLLQLIDSLTVLNELKQSIPTSEAMTLKGVYDRALPIIQTAVFFVSPLLSSMIPHIKKKEDYGKLILFILFLAFPAMTGLIFTMKDVNTLLFQDSKSTIVLQVFALSIVFYAILLTFSTLSKNPMKILVTIIIGLIVKYMGNLLLISSLHILGAAISTVVSLLVMNILIVSLNRNFLYMRLFLFIKIIGASFIMMLSLYVTSITIHPHLVITILIGVISYFLASLILNLKKADFIINH